MFLVGLELDGALPRIGAATANGQGETVYRIARAYGVAPEDLLDRAEALFRYL